MKAKYRPQDWEARLHGGVVRWNGKPYRIMIEGRGLGLYDIVTGDLFLSNINPLDDLLDISSLPLGYINTNKAVYLTRAPVRRYKQSVDQRAVTSFSFTHHELIPTGGHGEELFSEAFKKTFEDNAYPSIPRAIESIQRLTRAPMSLAISREVALVFDRGFDPKNIAVFWKMKKVGMIEVGTTLVKVPSDDMAFLVSKYLSNYLDWRIE